MVTTSTQTFTDLNTLLLVLSENNNLANVLLKSTTSALLIQPISCGLILLVLIPAIIRVFKPVEPGFIAITSLLISLVPAIVTTIDFVVLFVVVLVAQSRLSDATTGQFILHWGPGVWMTLAAMVCMWLGVIGLSAAACGCCGMHDKRILLRHLRYASEK